MLVCPRRLSRASLNLLVVQCHVSGRLELHSTKYAPIFCTTAHLVRVIGGFLRCTVHIIQAAFLLTANRVTCSNHNEFRDPQEARIAHSLSFPVIFVVKYSLSSFHPCSKAFTFGGTAKYSMLSITLLRHLSDPQQVYINPQVAPFLFAIPHLFMSNNSDQSFIAWIVYIIYTRQTPAS